MLGLELWIGGHEWCEIILSSRPTPEIAELGHFYLCTFCEGFRKHLWFVYYAMS